MDEKIGNRHSFGADHYWDQLYFTVIWENVEILFFVGNGDENVNYFVFVFVKLNTLSIFSHNLKKKGENSVFIIEMDFVYYFWTDSLISWARLQLLSLLQLFKYLYSISICFGDKASQVLKTVLLLDKWGLELLGSGGEREFEDCCDCRTRAWGCNGDSCEIEVSNMLMTDYLWPSWGDSLRSLRKLIQCCI